MVDASVITRVNANVGAAGCGGGFGCRCCNGPLPCRYQRAGLLRRPAPYATSGAASFRKPAPFDMVFTIFPFVYGICCGFARFVHAHRTTRAIRTNTVPARLLTIHYNTITTEKTIASSVKPSPAKNTQLLRSRVPADVTSTLSTQVTPPYQALARALRAAMGATFTPERTPSEGSL